MDNKENETLKPDNQNNNISETEKIPKVTNYSKKANGIILKKSNSLCIDCSGCYSTLSSICRMGYTL